MVLLAITVILAGSRRQDSNAITMLKTQPSATTLK
jgi:hypothetical protein